MRAYVITSLGEPMRIEDVAEPGPYHFTTPGKGVLISVEATGLSFPDVLQSSGKYQFKPPLPYTPGGEVAGTALRSTDSRIEPGDRVMALPTIGGLAERVVAPPHLTFRLPPELDMRQGAGLIMNYHTAMFALRHRGRLKGGEWVVVHGAAGGVGSAALQVAEGLGARTIAVVSSEEKRDFVAAAGVEHILLSSGPWKDEVRDLTRGGADVVLDPVGGERVVDSLRSLRRGGRLLVVGFADGVIPEVRLNRILLGNLELIGVGLGAWEEHEPELSFKLDAELQPLVRSGAVRPLVSPPIPFARAQEALERLATRQALGKVVVDGPLDTGEG